jgi:hypothetical protein
MIGNSHTLSGGFETLNNRIRYYELNAYRLSSALYSLTILYGDWQNAHQAEKAQAYRIALANQFGYDLTGSHEVNEGNDGVRKPRVFSAYIEDHIEIPNGEFRLGLRFDKIKVGEKELKDPYNITFDYDGSIADENFIDGPTFNYLSPRVGLAFHWLRGNILWFQYGKYVQPPPYELTLVNWKWAAAGFT